MELGTVYEAFVSEYVEVSTTNIQSATQENEDTTYQVSECVTIRAFLVDMDGERLYLGPAPDVIDEWVALSSVWRVRIVEEENLALEALKAMPTPQNDEEIH